MFHERKLKKTKNKKCEYKNLKRWLIEKNGDTGHYAYKRKKCLLKKWKPFHFCMIKELKDLNKKMLFKKPGKK